MTDTPVLLHGDCLERLAEVPDASVHLVLTDLPYGTTDRSGRKGSRLFAWDSVIPLDDLWVHLRRVLVPKGAVVLTADQPFTSQLVMSNPEWFRYEWVWKKPKTTGFLTANHRPMKQTEDILVFSPAAASPSAARAGNAMTYNPQGLVAVHIEKRNNAKRLGRMKILGNEKHLGAKNQMLGDSEYTQKWTNYPAEILEFAPDADAVHPTQKPVPLMEYLVRTYSNPNEMVLDCTMGSGTTGVAAVQSGRRFTGIERDPQWFQVACDRIAAARQVVEAAADTPGI